MSTTIQTGNSCSLCERIGLRPLTKQNILYYYAPLNGMVSYAAMSINVMNPSLAYRLFPKRDVTNFLLIHTLFGTTLYVFSRPHLQSVDSKKRVAYSILGSSMFTFGSILFWAIARNALPKDNNALSTAVGVASGFAIARLGYDYFSHVDSNVVAKTS
ncbi:uncharacterized protein LOC119071669 [Bradysia coprophila]|uniref:uncharacterized protein LOC119071669 n=1 Tax=Bradysia coprophila TaxID=38358 RepID=UPI00187D793D|nr:uncharacterized protein LOC119071669 [Bradysia coprophila]